MRVRLWPSESGIPADPLTAGLRWGFAQCWGWCSNRYPRLIPQVILRVNPRRKPRYAYMIIAGDEASLRDLYNLPPLFGGKWVVPILVILVGGPTRRVEILCTIRSYSVEQEWPEKSAAMHDSILTRALRKKTIEGLLIREETPGSFPPEVYYSLTSQWA